MDRLILKNITLDGRSVDIGISDGIIESILPASAGSRYDEGPEPATTIDCTGKTAMPGFVNAHTHAAMSLLRGVGEDMVLQDWLDHIWAIEAHLDRPFIHSATKVATLEMIKTGTTAFSDMYWHSRMSMKAASETGLRGLFSDCVCAVPAWLSVCTR